MDAREKAAFNAVFNHLALPARLPGLQDVNLVQIGQDILDRLLKATRFIANLAKNQYTAELECLRRSLQACKIVHKEGRVDSSSLLSAFRSLTGNDVLILHVTEQNAGLLIRRQSSSTKGDAVTVEALEVSPLSEYVLAASKLECDFPGCAVSIPFDVFNHEAFQNSLTRFLEQASGESITRFIPRSHKQGITVSESRETVDPGLITEVLMPILEVLGRRAFPPILRKRVRDEVCWAVGAEKPWRRAPFWLLLRVAVQRQLSTTLGSELGRLHYKLLMCQMVAQLLEDSLKIVEEYIKALYQYQRGKKKEPPKAPELELFVLLKTKLCSRIAKLKTEQDRHVVQQVRQAYETMLTLLEPYFDKVIDRATTLFGKAWELYKSTIIRTVYKLPRALGSKNVLTSGSHPLFLSLPNSGKYISRVFEAARSNDVPHNFGTTSLPDDFDPSGAVPRTFTKYLAKYRRLSDMEWGVQNNRQAVSNSPESCEAQCLSLANELKTYLNLAGSSYDENPEQKSIMLLAAMELWMSMDERATALFPLLNDYDMGLPSDILDTLQLSRSKDMKRLQRLRSYLRNRNTPCDSPRMTIFQDPTKGCFGERYYNESEDAPKLKALHERIEQTAQERWDTKKRECREVNARFKKLSETWLQKSHELGMDAGIIPIPCIPQCYKCSLKRRMNGMRIEVHEHPLPANDVHAKAVVFELDCPKAFLAYREATWTLIGGFAVQTSR